MKPFRANLDKVETAGESTAAGVPALAQGSELEEVEEPQLGTGSRFAHAVEAGKRALARVQLAQYELLDRFRARALSRTRGETEPVRRTTAGSLRESDGSSRKPVFAARRVVRGGEKQRQAVKAGLRTASMLVGRGRQEQARRVESPSRPTFATRLSGLFLSLRLAALLLLAATHTHLNSLQSTPSSSTEGPLCPSPPSLPPPPTPRAE